VWIASRSRDSAEALAGEFGASVADGIEEAVRDADVVVLTTSSAEPVVQREWFRPGTHVTTVGMGQELDQETLREGTLFVDRRESAEAEGKVDPAWIHAELGELLVGSAPGRSSAEELTVFRSLGIAVEDLFAAEYVVRRAHETGRGTTIDF